MATDADFMKQLIKEVNIMDENTWETNVTSQIIANEEGLYNAASSLATSVYDIRELADMMKSEFYDIIYNYPHSDIDMSLVDWTEIANEYMEDNTEDDNDDIPDNILIVSLPKYVWKTPENTDNQKEE